MHKTIARTFAAMLLTGSLLAQPVVRTDENLLGFSSERSVNQRQLESKFDAGLNPNNLRDWMMRISARPHHIGSAYNKENADFIASQFRSWGYDTKLEEFQVFFPTPKTRLVEMTAPETFRLKLSEPPLA